MPSLEDALRLWIPGGDYCQDPSSALSLAERYAVCHQAVEDFLVGHLSINDFLEILDGGGVDVDDYTETVSYNLSLL
jgi:hypothetical protein